MDLKALRSHINPAGSPQGRLCRHQPCMFDKDDKMIKILALGAIGYAAYRYFGEQRRDPAAMRLADGPLSE